MKSKNFAWRFVPVILVILSLACSLLTPQPTPEPLPTSTPLPTPFPTPSEPLPPALVEVDPAPGSQISLQPGFKFYFNQPMDRASVEASLSNLQGAFTWLDDATLSVETGLSLAPNDTFSFTLENIRAANGLALLEAQTLTYTTADSLRITQMLPEPGTTEVQPTSAVVVAFNQPVVALGADMASQPAPFQLDPPAAGTGEWLNTSTYIFYPEPALEGGRDYTVRLNPVVSTAGSPLSDDQPASWAFSTTLPRLLTFEPTTDYLDLDGKITLTFNQPMDTASVEAVFSFSGPGGSVPGQLVWEANDTRLTFTPAARLSRNSRYILSVSTQAKGRGGSALEAPVLVDFTTYPEMSILGIDPASGVLDSQYGTVTIRFSAPLPRGLYLDYITISPASADTGVYHYDETSLGLYGTFAPETTYTVTVSGAIEDKWGQSVGKPYTFTFSSPRSKPSVYMPYLDGSGVFYVQPDNPQFYIQAVNVDFVDVGRGTVPLDDLIAISRGGLDKRTYYPDNLTAWRVNLDSVTNTTEPVALVPDPDGGGLAPGIYYFYVQPPAGTEGIYQGWDVTFLVASQINMVLKVGPQDALVWAVDTRTNAPLANAPVTLYDENGRVLAAGQTDANGLWQTGIPTQDNLYRAFYAVTGAPGEDTFGMGISQWNSGISPWSYEIPSDTSPPHTQIYLYTDRPIYRPGQTIYFNAVVRQAFDGRYTPLPDRSIQLELRDDNGLLLKTFNLTLSEYGTVNGEYALSADAQPGNYYFTTATPTNLYAYFYVAEYRKPEIDLSVAFSPDEAQQGQGIEANVSAKYFFGAPVGNRAVTWALYTEPGYFSLPGYRVGQRYAYWMDPSFSDVIAEGADVTDARGELTLSFTDLPELADTTKLTLSVTVQDESYQYVSASDTLLMHPSDFYVGLRADFWAAQAGSAVGFDVLTADWSTRPVPNKTLKAEFSRVTWEEQEVFDGFRYVPVFTPVAASDLATGADGKARLSFTPEKPGTYVLTVSGGGASSQAMLWVGGRESAVWPNRSGVHLDLTPDQDEYRPGDTARVFIPNPFGRPAPALVTVERGTVHRSQLVVVEAGGSVFSLPLNDEDAPNVYLSITLLDGRDFRQGYTALKVKPEAQTLNVTLQPFPEQAGPGDEVTINLLVTDSIGRPVQGQFSLAVVDKAVLALADPTVPDILEAFYSPQPLGVNTGLTLAADSRRAIFFFGGKGGGGGDGGGALTVRREFPDTAYWNPTILTDADGRAEIKFTLPDSLTTWSADLRGLTVDTRVGQAKTEVVTSKPLLVRPVTPRFFVAGDRVELAAIVHNNTDRELSASVSLRAGGFKLDEAASPAHEVTLPAGGSVRVAWWGVAQDVSEASLLFSADAGEYQDQVLASGGGIPVLHYSAPQSFVTAGVLPEAGSRQEVVSLPRTFDPVGGGLTVELSPSLASVILDGLEVLEPPDPTSSNEYLLSYLLSHLETYRVIQAAGLDAPALKSRLETVLPGVVRNLDRNQFYDGSWAWYTGGQPDPYLTAYILFGLERARQSGFSVDDYTIEQARNYLLLPSSFSSQAQPEDWELDRTAFIAFAMSQTGELPPVFVNALNDHMERLSPWAQALLALAFDTKFPGNETGQALFSNLQGAAIRSASGAHWDSDSRGWRNPGTPLFTTAAVVYALSQRDPAAPILADAVRYLASQRDASGWWASSYESTWVTMALNQYMQGSGDYSASFAFDARLNGAPLAEGQASGPGALTTVTGEVPVTSLVPDGPNGLTINRQAGDGKLYYRALLDVFFPVETAPALDRGLSISRDFIDAACEKDCAPLPDVSLAAAKQVTARLTLTVPHDSYYVVVEDFIPAGAEILNLSLKTSQRFGGKGPEVSEYDPGDPFGRGWGWWWFDPASIYDDHITWTAEYLPAGTYVLTYTLVPQQAGTFQVIPARAWLNYFPEVQGRSAGAVFEIKP
ncbi:MAG: Ig-like domain-containing protein [Chloroflexota bacterium]